MLNKFIINTYVANNHNFSELNIYQLKNYSKQHKPIKIKKIQAQNCNRVLLEKIFLKNIKLHFRDFDYIQNQKTSTQHIYLLIEQIKSSGYISSIKILNTHIENHNYITLNIRINPIIKKIIIIDYKKLKIPSDFLKHLFKKQIGMPKNYYLINKNLNMIYLWYKSRGFAWIDIELMEQNILNSSSIVFKITEGRVKDVKLNCRTNNLYDFKLVNILNSLIKKELGLYSGSILNIKRIQKGIKHLKKVHLIQDCNYTIKRERTDFVITIQYDMLQNNQIYSYSYNSILKNHPNYKQIYNLLSKYLTNFKFWGIYTLSTQKLRIYYSIMHMNHYLKYTYKAFYSSKKINHFSVNFVVLQDYLQLKILFTHPYIRKQKKILGNLKINLYNKIIKNRLCYPFIKLYLHGLQINQKSNLSNYLYSFIFLVKYNLLNNMSMLQKGWAIYNKYAHIDLSIKDYHLYQCILQEPFKQSRIINVTKLFKYIQYKLIYLQISIVHHDFCIWNQPKAGQLIKINSKLFTYIKLNYNNSWHKLIYLGQSITIQYRQVFELPKLFKSLYYNAISIFSQCHFLINSKKYEPILYQSNNQENHIYFKGKEERVSSLCFFYIFNIEYHISKFKHLSIYCFWNHITYSDNQKQHKPYVEAMNNIYKHNVRIGSGVKFYIPIKRLPNIRLEYYINNNSEYCLRLRTDPKYND